jgi:WD40 repeat protein
LQCEDNLGEVQLFEIESNRVINTDAIDFDLEWPGEGLRTYSPLENIRRNYGADNKISQIIKIPGKPVVAIGDEVGTIRLYNYPNDGSDAYYQCFGEHLHTITKCVFTFDQRFFVSVSSADRCVMKWKMKFNDKKITRLMQLLV